MNNFSVGELASQIMEQGNLPTPQVPNLQATEELPPESTRDISDVVVTEEFMASILGTVPAPAPAVVATPIVEAAAPAPLPSFPPKASAELLEMQALVVEAREILGEMRTVLTEMTSVGSIGVNMANRSKDKEEEDEEEADPQDHMKAMLKRIKARKVK